MKPELKQMLVNTGSAALLGAGSLVSPGSANAEYSARPLTLNDPTWLQGDGSSISHLKTLLIGQNGTTFPMLEEVKEDIFSISPMDEFKSIMDVAGVLGGNELGCNQVNHCDWGKVNEVINGYLARGLVFHETMVVVKSNDKGGTGFTPILPPYSAKPDIYSPSAIVRPVNTRGFRELFIRGVVHEFLHQFAGFDHEGKDIMESECNCINAAHTQFLRELKALVPGNYWTPEFNFRDGFSAQQSIDQAKQLSQMEIRLPATDIPTGAKWLKFLVQQEDGPAITMIYGDPKVMEQFISGTYVIKAPQIGVGNYVLLPDQLTKVEVWVATTDKEPKWESSDWNFHKAWPDLTLESTLIKRYFRNPRADSTTISAATLANGEKTADSTPTLVWNNTRKDIFYYEIQVSGDPDFEMDPAKAKSFVYWNLIHGGESRPQNSYTIPDQAVLPPGKYFWRVKPRGQGSAQPIAWSQVYQFEVTNPPVQTRAENQPGLIKELYEELRDTVRAPEVINPPKITLKPGSVKVYLNPQKEAYLNRAQRRQLAGQTLKAA